MKGRFYLLGISLLLSTQMVQAEDQNRFSSDKTMIENLESTTRFNVPRSCDRKRAKKEKDVLEEIQGVSLSASGFLLRATGEISERTYKLTVLNAYSKQGLYRIQIEVLGGPRIFTHEFVLGRVGNEYFGQGIEDRLFGIEIKKVGNQLEVTYSVKLSTSGENDQVRAVFDLPD